MKYDRCITLKGAKYFGDIGPLIYTKIYITIGKEGIIALAQEPNDLAIGNLSISRKGVDMRKELLDCIDCLPKLINKFIGKGMDEYVFATLDYELRILFMTLEQDTRGFFQFDMSDRK